MKKKKLFSSAVLVAGAVLIMNASTPHTAHAGGLTCLSLSPYQSLLQRIHKHHKSARVIVTVRYRKHGRVKTIELINKPWSARLLGQCATVDPLLPS